MKHLFEYVLSKSKPMQAGGANISRIADMISGTAVESYYANVVSVMNDVAAANDSVDEVMGVFLELIDDCGFELAMSSCDRSGWSDLGKAVNQYTRTTKIIYIKKFGRNAFNVMLVDFTSLAAVCVHLGQTNYELYIAKGESFEQFKGAVEGGYLDWDRPQVASLSMPAVKQIEDEIKKLVEA